MAKSRLLLSDLLDQLSFALCIVRNDYVIVKANDYFQSRVIHDCPNITGQDILKLFPDCAEYLKRKIDTALIIESSSFGSWEQKPHILPFKSSRPVSGQEEQMFQDLEVIPIHSEDGSIEHVCLCIYDVTTQAAQQLELKQISKRLEQEHAAQQELIKKLEDAKGQLIQSEKMASIGQLSAGIAHEINNPVGFITSNLQSLKSYFDDLFSMIEKTKSLIDSSASAEVKQQFTQLLTETQLDFILDDTKDLIGESLDGTARVMEIVKNLKEFSHMDRSEWTYASLENCIESTLKIISNEIKYNIEVVKHYQPAMPEVYCQPMQINQVLLNLLVNAKQAIEGEGIIDITLKDSDGFAIIIIKDNGTGIPADIKEKIFDPFFTTKPVGSGTGLGLSVSYGIINKHKGLIEVESEKGKGTTFIIKLPIKQPNDAVLDGQSKD